MNEIDGRIIKDFLPINENELVIASHIHYLIKLTYDNDCLVLLIEFNTKRHIFMDSITIRDKKINEILEFIKK